MMYLDNASTTRLSNEMIEYLTSILPIFGNPSSLHSEGVKAKQIVDKARNSVASFINAPNESDILFTSSGSASNTLGIAGYYRKHNCTIFYSPTVHKSILRCVEDYKYSYPLRVDSQGFIDCSDLREWLSTRQTTPFVVLEYANSEIGTVQPVKEIIDLVHFYNGVVYLDCTGSVSQIPLDVNTLNVDMAGFSGHKLGALKGIGVLYKKNEIELEPLIYGEQEQHLFAGTENTLGITSIGKAVELHDYSSISSANRDYVWEYIQKNIPDTYLVGAPIGKSRLPHNLYIIFKGVQSETILIVLDSNDIQVSSGSACSQGNATPSHTLSSIGIPEDHKTSGIRFSFNGKETKEELDYVCKKLSDYITLFRKDE